MVPRVRDTPASLHCWMDDQGKGCFQLIERTGKIRLEIGRMIMSYDPRLLFERILTCLQESPCKTLEDLSQSLRLSERTIQKAVNLSTGRSFRFVRDEVILIRVKWLFEEQPELPIKEVSFGVGFKSASSFARAVKRACGLSPEELRSRVAHELPIAQTLEYSSVNRSRGGSQQRVKVSAL